MKKNKPKVRGVWVINPDTRIKESKKAYKRKKVNWRKEIDTTL